MEFDKRRERTDDGDVDASVETVNVILWRLDRLRTCNKFYTETIKERILDRLSKRVRKKISTEEKRRNSLKCNLSGIK